MMVQQEVFVSLECTANKFFGQLISWKCGSGMNVQLCHTPLSCFSMITIYVEYFTKAIIELIQVNTFLILPINLDGKMNAT